MLKGGAGGEGSVYSIRGSSRFVAKLYHEHIFTQDGRDRSVMQRKLECMLSMEIPVRFRGRLRLAWPVDILFQDHRFVGYVMPRVPTPYRLYDVWQEKGQRNLFPHGYTWRKSVCAAKSLAEAVAFLHDHGIILGDMNQKNLMVSQKGDVILVDTDSFNVTDPQTGEHFPCRVGLPDLLAPELQAAGRTDRFSRSFTKEADNFSLAIQIFRLLFNGYHPFNGVVTQTEGGSASAISQPTEIRQGNCPYVRAVPGRRVSRHSPVLSFLPEELQHLFQRAFSYNAATARISKASRPSAEEWVHALTKLYSGPFKQCSRDRRHLFPAHNRMCPFCKAPGKHRGTRAAAACLAVGLAMYLVTSGYGGEAIQWVQAAMSHDSSATETIEDPGLFPSRDCLLTEDDVRGMDRRQIQMGINELYARYGRTFSDEGLQAYFLGQSWYEPDDSLTDEEIVNAMTSIERSNLDFLAEHRSHEN